MQNSIKAQPLSNEVLTLYIIHTYLSPDPIYHEIFRDYYWRAYGINLDLCPREVIAHCEWLKRNMGCLFYHYYCKGISEEDHVKWIDKLIAQIKEDARHWASFIIGYINTITTCWIFWIIFGIIWSRWPI